jgi:hypothetical protein
VYSGWIFVPKWILSANFVNFGVLISKKLGTIFFFHVISKKIEIQKGGHFFSKWRPFFIMFSIIQLVGTVEQLYCPYLLILSIKKLVTVLFPIASSINLIIRSVLRWRQCFFQSGHPVSFILCLSQLVGTLESKYAGNTRRDS